MAGFDKMSHSAGDGFDVLPDAVASGMFAGARERYETSTDLTVGVEEEFAICDPGTLDLVHRFEDVKQAAIEAGMAEAISSELIASEAEFRIDKSDSFAQAADKLVDLRRKVRDLGEKVGVAFAASGTHPWSDYRQQQIVDTEYYVKVVELLQYVARRNNTFGLHVHVGVQGPDRAIAICDELRAELPVLLALSASSPYLDGQDSGLDSARTATFTNVFPRSRSGVPPAFGSWQRFEKVASFFEQSGSLLSAGQLWWSVRPHTEFGTVEIRMFDGQPDVHDTIALTALSMGLVGDCMLRHDAGELRDPFESVLIDENLWRAARFGLHGELVDLPASSTTPTRVVAERALERARRADRELSLGLESGLARVAELIEGGNAAQRQRARGSLREAYGWVVEQTMTSAERVTPPV